MRKSEQSEFQLGCAGKKLIDMIMLCQEWCQISEGYIMLNPSLVNCHDLTSGHFPLVNLHQTDMKSPLKWHNQPGKK